MVLKRTCRADDTDSSAYLLKIYYLQEQWRSGLVTLSL